jgi:predicted Zn-dependent protease
LEIAKQLVERMPVEPAAWQAQAVAAAMAGRSAEAEAAFQQWLRLAPHDPLAYANWGHFLTTSGKAQKAAEVLAVAANRFPGEGLIWLNLSDAQTALGEQEAASAARARAERLVPPEQQRSLVR